MEQKEIMNMFDIVQTIFNFFSMLYIHRFMTAFQNGRDV